MNWPKAMQKWPIASINWYEIKESGFNNSIGPVTSAHSAEPEHTWYTSLIVQDKNLNLGGVCHGGVLIALADNAMGHGSWHASMRNYSNGQPIFGCSQKKTKPCCRLQNKSAEQKT